MNTFIVVFPYRHSIDRSFNILQMVNIPVTNHFSLLLIDRYILAVQQIITHKEHLQYSFWSVPIFWTSSEALAPTESG